MNWINQHAAAIQVIAAVATAILSTITTAFIVAYTNYTKQLLQETRRQSADAHQQLAETQKQTKGSFMPVLVVVHRRDSESYVLENHGKGVALNIRYALQLPAPDAKSTAAGPIGAGSDREIPLPGHEISKHGLYVQYADAAGNEYESEYVAQSHNPFVFRQLNRGSKPLLAN